MSVLVTVNKTEILFKLNLNYNNLYARLRSILGENCIMAEINPKPKQVSWLSPDGPDIWVPFSEMSGPEKKTAEDHLRMAINATRSKLSNVKDVAPLLEELLEVPEARFVFCSCEPDWKILLCAWGCRRAHVAEPANGYITDVVIKDKSELQEVAVRVMDANGGPLSDNMMCDYNNEHNTFTPGPNGEAILGQFLVGTSFYVSNLRTAEKQAFTVTKGCRLYYFQSNIPIPNINSPKPSPIIPEVPADVPTDVPEAPTQNPEIDPSIPKQRVKLFVWDKDGNRLPYEQIEINIAGQKIVKFSDASGVIDLGNLDVSSVFSASLVSDREAQNKQFTVQAGKEQYDFYCHKVELVSPVLSVEDKNGLAVTNHNVRVIVSGAETSYNSGENGIISLPEMTEGTSFIVVDSDNQEHYEDFVASTKQKNGIYHFVVERKKEQPVSFLIVNRKGVPIKGCELHLSLNNEDCAGTTDANGEVSFPESLFEGATDIPSSVRIPGAKQDKSFITKYTPTQRLYKITVRNQKPPLLHILLPALGLAGLLIAGVLLLLPPSFNKLSKGIVLVQTQCLHYAELKSPDGRVLHRIYYHYDANERSGPNLGFGTQFYGNDNDNFDGAEPYIESGFGTGFLVSKKGEIVTNKHVAHPDPAPLEDFQKHVYSLITRYSGLLNTRLSDEDRELYKGYLNTLMYFYNNSNLVETHCLPIKTSVAFVSTIIEESSDLDNFKECSERICGESWLKDDIAIIQLKEIESLPKDYFIYKIPKHDPLRKRPVEKRIKVIGYNGALMQTDNIQGITPQATHGRITAYRDEYRVTYDAATLGGSSGSPVVDLSGRLVAVNNSGSAANFNHGIRISYLIDMYNKLHASE